MVLQVVMLSNSETRFGSTPLRGSSLLPEWLRETRSGAAEDEDEEGVKAGRARAARVKAAAQQAQQEGREEEKEEGGGGQAAAEALAEALRGAGCKAAARQLLFGDWAVVFQFRDSGQAAVLPWQLEQRAANEGSRAVGCAVATRRILASKGFPVVLGSQGTETTVAECIDLWT